MMASGGENPEAEAMYRGLLPGHRSGKPCPACWSEWTERIAAVRHDHCLSCGQVWDYETREVDEMFSSGNAGVIRADSEQALENEIALWLGWTFTAGTAGRSTWWHPPGEPGSQQLYPPMYASDLERAWSVVERMRELGFFLTLEVLPSLVDARFWRMGENGVRWEGALATCEAPAEAICRAALGTLAQMET